MQVSDSEALTDERFLLYTNHLKKMQEDMKIRFSDLLDLDVPLWVMQPFQADLAEAEPAIQEQLIDVQSDEEAEATFRISGWDRMWLTYAEHYPTLWERTRLFLLAFPTTYLVDRGFSQVLHMQPKHRNRLDLCTSGALRLKLTSLQPDAKKLAYSHKPQGSQ